ncbi:MAG: biosynthetic peptidoglycan transglycosylase [Bacteriovoracia bacterium]
MSKWNGFFLLALGFAAAFALAVFAFVLTIPDISSLKKQYPVVHYDAKKKSALVKLQLERPRGWVTLGEVPRAVRGAILVSEDWAFFNHPGYDLNQIEDAIGDSLERKKLVRGASTITQQVVRNVFLDQKKSLFRKARELILAIQIEKLLSKERILEIYLNIVELGEGTYGLREGARLYFQKSPTELNPREGAFLAVLLPSPKRYSQSFRKAQLTPFIQHSIKRVLERMAQAHYLDPAEIEGINAQTLSFEKAPPGTAAPTEDESPDSDPDPDF